MSWHHDVVPLDERDPEMMDDDKFLGRVRVGDGRARNRAEARHGVSTADTPRREPRAPRRRG